MSNTMAAHKQLRQLLLLVVATFATTGNMLTVTSFAIVDPRRTTKKSVAVASPTLLAAGGMGMGTKQKSSKTNKKKKRATPSVAATSTPFDVAKSMIKSEKLYDELMVDAAKSLLNDDNHCDGSAMVTTEYVIAARGKPKCFSASSSFLGGAADWIPVVQLCLVRHHAHDDEEHVLESQLRTAVFRYRREIHYAACLAAPSAFQSLPRHDVEYAAEPLDSFHRHVYEEVIEGKRGEGDDANGAGPWMTKATARKILHLEPGCADAARIKTAFKQQVSQHHPDRVPEKDKEAASERFAQIRMAYNTLNSGVRQTAANGPGGPSQQSWYESLGGRDRIDFTGPLELPFAEKSRALSNQACKSAVVGLDPDLTMAFVARNQAAVHR